MSSAHQTWRWRKLSLAKRKADPLCERCALEGVVTPATEVNHIIPISKRPELLYEWSNLQSVCRPCHIETDRAFFRGCSGATIDGDLTEPHLHAPGRGIR